MGKVIDKVKEVIGENVLVTVSHNLHRETFKILGLDNKWHSVKLINDEKDRFFNTVDWDGDMCAVSYDEEKDTATLSRYPGIYENNDCQFEMNETGEKPLSGLLGNLLGYSRPYGCSGVGKSFLTTYCAMKEIGFYHHSIKSNNVIFMGRSVRCLTKEELKRGVRIKLEISGSIIRKGKLKLLFTKKGPTDRTVVCNSKRLREVMEG